MGDTARHKYNNPGHMVQGRAGQLWWIETFFAAAVPVSLASDAENKKKKNAGIPGVIIVNIWKMPLSVVPSNPDVVAFCVAVAYGVEL